MEVILHLNIPPYLQDYMRNFFTVKNKALYLDLGNDIGKMINSLLSKPEGFDPDSEGIKIVLPRNAKHNNRYMRNYLTREALKKVTDFLTVDFDSRFYSWMLKAEAMGLGYNFAIGLFLRSKKIHIDNKNSEALKKKYFRFRKKTENEFIKAMEELAA